MQAGCTHSLAVTRDGLVYSWGSSEHGKLGHGPAPDVETEGALMTTHTKKWWPFCPTPMEVNGLRGRPIAKVACGEFHSLAATIDGEVLAWGLSGDGRLGIEPSEEHSAVLSTTRDGKCMQANLPVAVDNLPWGCVEREMCCESAPTELTWESSSCLWHKLGAGADGMTRGLQACRDRHVESILPAAVFRPRRRRCDRRGIALRAAGGAGGRGAPRIDA